MKALQRKQCVQENLINVVKARIGGIKDEDL